jgi:hypothetical protein
MCKDVIMAVAPEAGLARICGRLEVCGDNMLKLIYISRLNTSSIVALRMTCCLARIGILYNINARYTFINPASHLSSLQNLARPEDSI